MHWPEPVKTHFVGRGKILSSGVAVTAAVFGVLVLGLWGLLILAGLIVVFLAMELWIEDGIKSAQLSAATGTEAGLRKELSAAKDELEEADARAIDRAGLRAELAEAQAEIDRLRGQLAGPITGFETLIEGNCSGGGERR